METYLLVHPVGNRMPVQVMLEHHEGYDQRQQPLAVVLDKARELQPTAGAPTFGRRCLRSTGDSSGIPSGARSLSAWVRWLIKRDSNDKNSRALPPAS
jgi:hypothetical protein